MNCFAFSAYCLVFTATLLSSTSSTTGQSCGDCIIIALFSPVCGSDGKSYSNEGDLRCQALCNPNLTLAYKGICRHEHKPSCGDCICIDEYEPVCGSDGKTHGNACYLKCQSLCNPDLTMAYLGECNKRSTF